MELLLRLSITVLFSLFSAQTLLAQDIKCPKITAIDDAREAFLKSYQQKKYSVAYKMLSQSVNSYWNAVKVKTWTDHTGRARVTSSLCFVDNKQAKHKLLWAYSDLALAAYKLKDAQLCLSNYVKSSDLGYNIYSKKKTKLIKALNYNYLNCVGLPNVEEEIISNACNKKYEDCFQLKHLVAFKIHNKYPKTRSKNPLYPKGLDLKPFGMQGTIFLKGGFNIGDDESKKLCPKIYWAKDNIIKELKLKTGDKYDYETDLEDVSTCCNILAESLALTKQKSGIKLQVTYNGTDCFGGSARWFSEEIYGINFKKYQIKREAHKQIGMNMY